MCTQMTNMPLFKCLLLPLTVLSCVGAIAPPATREVDITKIRNRRALSTTPAPSPKDCAALNDKKTCRKKDRIRVDKACSGGKKKKCTKLCTTANKKKSLSAICKEACCRMPPR